MRILNLVRILDIDRGVEVILSYIFEQKYYFDISVTNSDGLVGVTFRSFIILTNTTYHLIIHLSISLILRMPMLRKYSRDKTP